MSMSNYAEDQVMKWLLSTTSITRPTTWYVALYTATPSDTGGGTELSGSGYARQSITFTISGTNPTQAANSAQIDFPTASGSWGTVTHAAIFDASTSGNMLWWGALTASKAVASGDVFRIASGALVLTID